MSKAPKMSEILVVVGRPLNDNPFLASRQFVPSDETDQPGYSVVGELRTAVLEAFRAGKPGPYTFWDTRNTNFVEGRELKSPDQILWE